MFISWMNRFLDKHGRVAIIIIGLLMVIPFMFFWGPSSTLFDNLRGGGSKIGTMYGEPITVDKMQKNLIAARLELFMQYGQWLQNNQQLEQIIFQEALRRMRVLHEAEKRELDAVGRTEVEEHIRDMFSRDGRFDKEMYQGFIRNMVVNQGLSEDDFVDIVRDNIVIDRLVEQVTSPVFVSPLEVEQEVKREYEEFTVLLRHYRADEYLEDVEVNEDEVEEFYSKRVESFQPFVDEGMKPEEIVSAARQGLLGSEGANLTEDMEMHEVAESADDYLSRYYIPRQKRVIAVEFDWRDYLDEVENPAETAVEEYYEENKEDYKLDREEASEGDNEEEGGDEYKPLPEVESEIIRELKKEKASELAVADADEFAYEAFETSSQAEKKDAATVVRQIAEERGLEWEKTPAFRPGDKLAEFADNSAVTEKAFKVSSANPVSNVIRENHDCYIACWAETVPGYIPELGEETADFADVEQQLRQLKAVKTARRRAEENYMNLSRQLDGGKDFAEFAAALMFEKVSPFSRREPPENRDYARLLLTKVTQASPETLLEPFDTDNGAVVAYLADRELPSEETIEEQRERIRRRLKQEKRRRAEERFYKKLQEESETRLREGVSGQMM